MRVVCDVPEGYHRRMKSLRFASSLLLTFALLTCSRGGTPWVEEARDARTSTDDASEDAEGAYASADSGSLERSLTVMTFNVLCSLCDTTQESTYDPWKERLTYFGDIFERYDADLIGLQELIAGSEVEQILEEAPGYEAHYYNKTTQYADATILWRAERFELKESGAYWLSPRPDVALSTGLVPVPALPRLVVWALLFDRARDEELLFATSHFDPNDPAPELSAPIVLERSEPWLEEVPVIFTGDLNHRPDEAGYRILVGLEPGPEGTSSSRLEDAYELCASHREEANSAPAPDYDPAERIDHIMVGGSDWGCDEWAVDLHVYGPHRRFPSDHYAVVAYLR